MIEAMNKVKTPVKGIPSEVKEQFDLSVILVKNLKKKPSDEELLTLYGLYKQSLEGDCRKPQPGFLELKETAKWKAWAKLKGTAPVDTMTTYTNLVLKLAERYGLAQG